ncbi:MAG: hypothetical protein Tsb006_1910 [Rickettsiaceae bacterium]
MQILQWKRSFHKTKFRANNVADCYKQTNSRQDPSKERFGSLNIKMHYAVKADRDAKNQPYNHPGTN